MIFNTITSTKFCEKVFDGTHDSPKYVSNGYPLVTSRFITKNTIEYWLAPKISQKDFDSINIRSKVQKNDILISMIGTVGSIARITNDPNYAIKNIGVLRLEKEIDSKYIYYYMQSDFAQEYIKSCLNGSTQQFLSLDKLRNFPLLVPYKKFYKQHIVDTICYF